MAAPALVGTPTTATNISDGATVATPSSAASGEWLLAVLAGRTVADTASGTELTLAGFTVLSNHQSDDDGAYRTTWLAKEVDATDIAGTTYAFGASGATGPTEGGAIIYRVDVEPALDVAADGASFGTDLTIESITTTEDDGLVLVSLHRQGGGAALAAPPSPYADQAEAQGYVAIGADDLLTAGAAGGETWTGLSFGSYWSTIVSLYPGATPAALGQEGYRWGTDGTEAGHGWEAAQDTDPAALPAETTTLLRVAVDNTGGPFNGGLKLRYKRDDEAADQWRDTE